MSDFDRVTGLRTGGSDHDHESDSESSEVVLKHKKDYVAALQGAGVAASMNWKLASLQEAWNQHKRGGGHSEATAVEEPAAEATVEEPAAEAAVEEPAAEAAVEEPAAEAAVEEPAAVKEPRPMEAVDAVKVGQSPDPPCRQVPSEELQLAAIAQQLVQLPRSERISRLEVLVSSWKSQDDSFCLPKAVEVNVREEPAKKTKAVAEPAREKPPLKKRRNYYLQAMRSLGVKTTWSTGQGGSGRLGFVLSEPFNREAVEHFGSLRAAAQLGFRRALAALLVRDTEAAGVVKVAYRECHTVADLFDVETLGRAYGGYVAKHYEELAKRLKKIDPVKGQDDVDAISAQMGIYMQLPPVFGNLQKLGMSSFAASNSAFSFSRALKDRACLLERFLSPWMGERFFRACRRFAAVACPSWTSTSSAVPGGSCWGDTRAPPGLGTLCAIGTPTWTCCQWSGRTPKSSSRACCLGAAAGAAGSLRISTASGCLSASRTSLRSCGL